MKRIAVIALAALLLPLGSPAEAAKSELVATINSNVNNLYPAKGTTAEEYNFAVLVFNGLVRITEDLKIEPELAESWTANADATEWTFRLRKGVRFHHGKEFKAEDVVHTFALIADPNVASRAKSTADMVKSIETIDDHTVKFILKEPYGAWPDMLIERQLKIVPADRTPQQLATEPVGTGPFVFESYTPGDKVVVRKNADYWEKGEPRLDRVILRIMPEDAAKVAAFSAGDVDLIWNLPLEAIEQLQGMPGVTVDSKPTGTWDGFVLNNKEKPFDDVRVRRAILKALDKRQLVKFAVFGHGAPTHSPIPPNHPFFRKDIGFEPDIAGAKKLLAEAGYPKGFSITLHAPVGRPTRERAAVALQQMLKAINVNVKIERVPYSRWGATIAGKAPFYMDGYLSRPTIDTATYPWFHSSGSWNTRMWHFKSERIDRVLDEARRTTDQNKLRSLYGEFQQYVVEDVPGVVMYVIDFATAYKSELKGYTTHPYLWMDLRKAHFE
jgi:peptide/nickel transport system substrate-binding protein